MAKVDPQGVHVPGALVLGAVGLFLFDAQGAILLIRRQGSHGAGQWGLPGGKIDFGETLPDCAARELAEETGVAIDPASVRIGPTITDYWPEDGRHFACVFASAPAPADAAPRIMEFGKADGIGWFPLDGLPTPLFQPLENVMSLGINLPFPWRDPAFGRS